MKDSFWGAPLPFSQRVTIAKSLSIVFFASGENLLLSYFRCFSRINDWARMLTAAFRIRDFLCANWMPISSCNVRALKGAKPTPAICSILFKMSCIFRLLGVNFVLWGYRSFYTDRCWDAKRGCATPHPFRVKQPCRKGDLSSHPSLLLSLQHHIQSRDKMQLSNEWRQIWC